MQVMIIYRSTTIMRLYALEQQVVSTSALDMASNLATHFAGEKSPSQKTSSFIDKLLDGS